MIVILAADLHQRRFVYAIGMHLLDEDLYRLEPMG